MLYLQETHVTAVVSSAPRYLVELHGTFLYESIEVEAVDSSRKLVTTGIYHAIFRVSSLRATDFLQIATKRACVCDITNIDDINQVQTIASNKGAAALFVLTRPTARSDLPVFVVSNTVMKKLSSMYMQTVTFELFGPPDAQKVEVPRVNGRPLLSHATDKAVESSPPKRTNLGSTVEITYGARDEEIRMGKWLNVHLLPQTVADALLELGARCIEDVKMLVQECPDLLSQFAPLDRVKLKKAAGADGKQM